MNDDASRTVLMVVHTGRDEATERDVDPMRIVGDDGRWYLEGWCHRAEDTRLFRMDRVEELTVLDVDGPTAILDLGDDTGPLAQQVVRSAVERGEVREFGRIIPSLSEIYREVAA